MADDMSTGGGGLDYDHLNNVPGNPREGKYYAIEQGNGGQWHIYKDGTKEFVANSPVASTDGGATAPASTTPPLAAPSAGATNSQVAANAATNSGNADAGAIGTGPLINTPPIGGSVPVASSSLPAPSDPWDSSPTSTTVGATNSQTAANAATNSGNADAGAIGTGPLINTPPIGGSVPVQSTLPAPRDPWDSTLPTPAAVTHTASAATESSNTSGSFGGELPASAANTEKRAEEQVSLQQHKIAQELEGGGDSGISLNITHPMLNGQSAQPITATVNADVPGSTGATYKVVHGDTLSGIADAKGIPLAQLEALNRSNIPDPNLIHPGDVVHLGSTGSSVSIETVTTTSVFPEKPTYPMTSIDPRTGGTVASPTPGGWAAELAKNAGTDIGGIIENGGKTDTDPTGIGKHSK